MILCYRGPVKGDDGKCGVPPNCGGRNGKTWMGEGGGPALPEGAAMDAARLCRVEFCM